MSRLTPLVSAVTALTLLLATPVFAQAPLEGLTPEQQDFINDPENLRPFGLTKKKLEIFMTGRDAAAIQATVNGMMETAESAAYQPADGPQPDGQSELDPVGDMPEVLLNTKAGNFNSSSVLRPAILDKIKRAPGPFSLKRYMFETDGIPTFAGAPVAIRKADLVAGRVDVAFVGIPLNLGSGYRDSQHAPNALRGMYGVGGYDIYGGIDPSVELILADYGNLNVNRMAPEVSVDHIRMMIADMADAGTIPFIIGGDHSIMFPTVAAMTDQYGKGNVGVVHLDAHYNGARDLDHYYSDEQSVSRLIQEDIIDGKNLVQVGIRGQELSEEALTWMRGQDVRYHSMAEIEDKGWERVMKTAIAEAKSGPDNLFISFDISVLDPAYAQGAGRPVSGGLTMREAIPLVRRLCAETNVVGFEMLDVQPFLDLSYKTTLNANSIMHACLTGIALRKTGVKKADYLSSMTVSD